MPDVGTGEPRQIILYSDRQHVSDRIGALLGSTEQVLTLFLVYVVKLT